MICLSCGEELEHTMDLFQGESSDPDNGDISVCMYCAHVAVFKDGGLVPMPDDHPLKDSVELELVRETVLHVIENPPTGEEE